MSSAGGEGREREREKGGIHQGAAKVLFVLQIAACPLPPLSHTHTIRTRPSPGSKCILFRAGEQKFTGAKSQKGKQPGRRKKTARRFPTNELEE